MDETNIQQLRCSNIKGNECVYRAKREKDTPNKHIHTCAHTHMHAHIPIPMPLVFLKVEAGRQCGKISQRGRRTWVLKHEQRAKKWRIFCLFCKGMALKIWFWSKTRSLWHHFFKVISTAFDVIQFVYPDLSSPSPSHNVWHAVGMQHSKCAELNWCFQ